MCFVFCLGKIQVHFTRSPSLYTCGLAVDLYLYQTLDLYTQLIRCLILSFPIYYIYTYQVSSISFQCTKTHAEKREISRCLSQFFGIFAWTWIFTLNTTYLSNNNKNDSKKSEKLLVRGGSHSIRVCTYVNISMVWDTKQGEIQEAKISHTPNWCISWFNSQINYAQFLLLTCILLYLYYDMSKR